MAQCEEGEKLSDKFYLLGSFYEKKVKNLTLFNFRNWDSTSKKCIFNNSFYIIVYVYVFKITVGSYLTKRFS